MSSNVRQYVALVLITFHFLVMSIADQSWLSFLFRKWGHWILFNNVCYSHYQLITWYLLWNLFYHLSVKCSHFAEGKLRQGGMVESFEDIHELKDSQCFFSERVLYELTCLVWILLVSQIVTILEVCLVLGISLEDLFRHEMILRISRSIC